MREDIRQFLYPLIHQLSELHIDSILYAVLLVSTIIVLDDVLRAIKIKSKRTGISTANKLAIKVDGAKKHTAKSYISEIQGISGRPDAVMLEGGHFIPVERKPLGNKVHDRHIAQLLVYMRLVEEFEGKRPPYGYLILGKKARKIKIYNSEQRQQWLSEQLKVMRAIVEEHEKPALKPHPHKCSRCKVQDQCEMRLSVPSTNFESADLIRISGSLK